MVKSSTSRKSSTNVSTTKGVDFQALLEEKQAEQPQEVLTPTTENTSKEGEIIMTQTSNVKPGSRSFIPTAKREKDFDYDENFALITSGRKALIIEGLETLHKQLTPQKAAAQSYVDNMGRDAAGTTNQHKARRGRRREVNRTLGQMLGTITKTLEKKDDPKAFKAAVANFIAKMEDHHVLHVPFFGKMSNQDLYRVMMGRHTAATLKADRDPLRGMRNSKLNGYAYVSRHDAGWVVNMDGESYLLQVEELHNLIVEQYIQETWQRVGFSQECVMASNTHNGATPNGVTMVLRPNGAFCTIDGQTITFENMRLSMDYQDWFILMLATAYIELKNEKLEKEDEDYRVMRAKYKQLGTLTQYILGDAARLAQNRFDADRLWKAYFISMTCDNEVYIMRSKEEIEKPFKNGGWAASYFESFEDLRDPVKAKAGLLKQEADRAKRADDNTANRQTKPVVAPTKAHKSVLPAAESDETFDNPFGVESSVDTNGHPF